jgi:hypothetical protein
LLLGEELALQPLLLELHLAQLTLLLLVQLLQPLLRNLYARGGSVGAAER